MFLLRFLSSLAPCTLLEVKESTALHVELKAVWMNSNSALHLATAPQSWYFSWACRKYCNDLSFLSIARKKYPPSSLDSASSFMKLGQALRANSLVVLGKYITFHEAPSGTSSYRCSRAVDTAFSYNNCARMGSLLQNASSASSRYTLCWKLWCDNSAHFFVATLAARPLSTQL